MLELNYIDSNISIDKLYGENTYIYLNKSDTKLSRDRVVASFVSDMALNSTGYFNQTLFKLRGLDGESIMVKCSPMLGYMATISAMYYFRAVEESVIGIYNISVSEFINVISVEDMGTETNVIKVNITDEHKDILSSIIEEHEDKEKSRHFCSIVDVEITDSSIRGKLQLLEEVIKQMNEQEPIKYTMATERGDLISILDYEDYCYVIGEETILVVSNNKSRDAEILTSFLNQMSENNNFEIEASYRNNVIMF